MKNVKQGNRMIAVLEEDEDINCTQDALDALANARYRGCEALVVYRQSLSPAFFDLKTGLAGEILQKFSNYRMPLCIVGDFSAVKSKALRDFIYECNKGNLVFFKPSLQEGLEAVSR